MSWKPIYLWGLTVPSSQYRPQEHKGEKATGFLPRGALKVDHKENSQSYPCVLMEKLNSGGAQVWGICSNGSSWMSG